ncbi:hypothetical protein OIO90_005526 [Microbotryomycetes sp. JL221]|nr:hypothetical protein OIO90_005526 [Microbotryomycetes sp. JL221]
MFATPKPHHARIHASQSDYFDGTHTLLDGRHVLQPMTPPQRKERAQRQAMQQLIGKSASQTTNTTSSSGSRASLSTASKDGVGSSNSSNSAGSRSFGKKLKSLTWASKKLLQPSIAFAPSTLSQSSTLAPSNSSGSTNSRPMTPQCMRPPPSPLSPNSPYTGAEQRHSTIVAFPAPPSAATSQSAKQHAVASMLPPSRALFKASDSASSMSTHKTTSSFASSSLFMHTDDEDEASYTSATSLSTMSSPSSKDKLWRVRGLSESSMHRHQHTNSSSGGALLAVQEVDEDNLSCYSKRTSIARRNSTSVTDLVTAMLTAGSPPDTPECRVRRWSAGSADARERDLGLSQHHGHAHSDSIDADNESESPRYRRRASNKAHPTASVFNGPRWQPGHSVRIPSMRFDGLAMDQAFAEIEQRVVDGSPRCRYVNGALTTSNHIKGARRRTRVLSTYRPTSTLPESMKVSPPTSPTKVERGTLTLSISDLESLRGPSPKPSFLSTTGLEGVKDEDDAFRRESLVEQMGLLDDAPRPSSSASKRVIVRPAPVDVELANLTFFGPVRESMLSAGRPRSRSPSARPPRALTPASAKSASPHALLSPFTVNDASHTPTQQSSCETKSLKVTTPQPLTPTSPIPKVCIFAPNSSLAQSSSEVESLADIERGRQPATKAEARTSIKVVQPKRVIRISTRAPPRPNKSLLRRPSLPLLAETAQAQTAPPPLPSPTLSATSSTSGFRQSPTFSSPQRATCSNARSSRSSVDSKRTSGVSSTGSDCEAQLDTLMHKLNQPYSPKATFTSKPFVASPAPVVAAIEPEPIATTPLTRDFSQDSLSRESPLRPRVLVTDADEEGHESDGDHDERKRLTVLRQHDAELAQQSEEDKHRLNDIAQMMMEAATRNGRWTPTPDDDVPLGIIAQQTLTPQLESPVDPAMSASFNRALDSTPVASTGLVASPAAPTDVQTLYRSRPLSAVFEEEQDEDDQSTYNDEEATLPDLEVEENDYDERVHSPSTASLSESCGLGDLEDRPCRLAPAAIILDPIEQEINATLASIESHPSFDQGLFSFETRPTISSFPQNVSASDSFNSSRSSIAYLIESPVQRSMGRSSTKGSLVHSRTFSSDLSSILSGSSVDDDTEDNDLRSHQVVATRYVSSRRPSSGAASVRTSRSRSSISTMAGGQSSSGCSSVDEYSELGVVMMGQRVSCTYDVGVIGMAL